MSLLKQYNSIINQRVGIIQFLDIFSNEDECLELYFNLKYAGRNCQRCNRAVLSNYDRIYRENMNGVPKKAFRCKSCHTYIYPLANSIFRGSSISIKHIFFIIYMLCASKNSLSAVDITKQVDVSYKTAHRLIMLVRMVLYNAYKEKMSGVIEIDEAFFGNGSRMYHWSGISTRKEPVIGFIQRDTRQIRLFLVTNRSAKTINKLVRDNVETGSTIYTDSWRGYSGLAEHYNHEIVDHSKREYVRGDVHTNGIESVWSHVKRNLRKTHIKISEKYIHLYIAEACWRHNSIGKLPMQLFNEILIRSFSVFDLAVT